MSGKLKKDFYTRSDVTGIAGDLLGKVLSTKIDGKLTSGIIVETEAYRSDDRACHAFQKKKTKRNSVMFGEGGIAYVFMNYGIHFLFNVVTNIRDEPDAVLIRALEPVEGIDEMMIRRMKQDEKRITSGPGALTRALGINLEINGEDLAGKKCWIEVNDSLNFRNFSVVNSKRIGIDYAGEHAMLPWRFYIKNNPWVSKP
jgi:DNA-3-methyladenine glycosylase